MWGGLADKVKLHLVNWKYVCQSIQSGGLGIKRFTSLNTALLGKWLLRFAMEPNALWRTVITNKYGLMRVVGVLEFPMNLMGFLCGSLLEGVGGGFLKIPDLW